MSREMKICEVCGKRFLAINKNHSICSEGCRNKKNADKTLRKYREKHNKEQDAPVEYLKQKILHKKCLTCGTEFETFDDDKKFCSLNCRKAKALDMTATEYAEHKAGRANREEPIPMHKNATLVAYIIYQCYDCKRQTKVCLEEGVEVGDCSKPAPFELACPHCSGVMREIDSWRPLTRRRQNRNGEKYLATFPEGDVAVYIYNKD